MTWYKDYSLIDTLGYQNEIEMKYVELGVEWVCGTHFWCRCCRGHLEIFVSKKKECIHCILVHFYKCIYISMYEHWL
jgi:hypothetical protein